MKKCIGCGKELQDDPREIDALEDGAYCHYTELGNGPFCGACYEYWQGIDDKLKEETDTFFNVRNFD